MKNLLIVVLALMAVVEFTHARAPIKLNLRTAVKMSHKNTVTSYETVPTIIGSDTLCAYAGRLVYPGHIDGCPNIFLYHLVRSEPSERNGRWVGFTCYYDISMHSEHLSVDTVLPDCPDLLISSGQSNFFDSLYFGRGSASGKSLIKSY